ncbi:hypothetical protein EJ04DRAFT_580072 [Polyplosphaeria fusca]|uniref:Prolyl 4-hydroxylase alpha subunit domain-containing protein n=1 Tax=Polyplosphaeria fusca TaxID=682080 RepID=A0A9P4QSK0_9PLEO|nr:hypothetical protein EJ04DRAFT_580072 [Polyplosphaeria fusca]
MADKAPTKSKSTGGIVARALFLVLPLALPAAFWSSHIQTYLTSQFQSSVSTAPKPAIPAVEPPTGWTPEACAAHQYTTEIVSLDPLVIYINNFTSQLEAEGLVKAGYVFPPIPYSCVPLINLRPNSEPDFEDSVISHYSGLRKVTGRTSQSAPLEPDLPLVSCILGRARKFMGSMLLPHEPFSTPQLVRYFPSQKYDLHTDFWPAHQLMPDGSGRLFNRVASFFVFLRANCTDGYTYFPEVDVLDRDAERSGGGGGNLGAVWKGKAERGERQGEKKGVRFKPIAGNALFWVNLDGKGRGDQRLIHAGLPVGEGEKVGMNLWPRKFYASDE